ncbi:MAG: transposase [Methanothrix sp.]|nr:transposase [Methanothrix sp.]
MWLKNPENLTEKQKKEIGSLKDMRLRTIRAYALKLSLRDPWGSGNALKSIYEYNSLRLALALCYPLLFSLG